MSEVATKNLTFWDTTDYKYPGFGQTGQISDGLGGTIGITYNKIDYEDRAWKRKPDGDTPITEDRLLSGEIENKFSLTGQVKGITVTMPQIRTIGRENNYSVTIDFSNYKASLTGSKATDGATCGDTYLAISRFFNGSNTGYTTIKVTATTLDGSPVNLADWKLFNSGTLGKGHNARIFLDAATQTISGKNSQGKQEFCPTPPNPGTSFGTDTGLGLFQLPSNQRYTSITLTFKQKKIKGTTPNDLHDIYVASNTTSTSPISETPETKPMDINSGLQLHLPLNEIVENAAKEKEVVDISAGKLNGKVHGPTVVADDRFGHCINFDGVDDYIQMPEMNIDYSKGITVEAWVYYNSFKHQSRVIDFANGPGKNNIIFGNHNTTNDGLLVVFVGSTRKAIEVKGILEASKWLHLTATIDESGNAKVYKDGQEVGGGLVAVPNSVNRTKNYIGVSNWSGEGYFHGKMTNLRIYDRVLSPEEINECMKVDGTPPPMDINSGLQLHLPLNEIVENAAKEKEVIDVSGNKLNGKVHGAKIVPDSQFGNCVHFDGVDDYIDLPKETIPQTGTITISFWAYGGKSLPKNTVLISAYNKGNQPLVRVYLPWSDRRIIFDYGNPFDRIEKVGEAVDFKDKWTYWTFTKNVAKGEMNIYLNGTLWHSGTGKDKAIDLDSVVQVMFGRETHNSYYNGQIAHLRIYDRVLSPEDINECMKVDGTPPPMDINSGLQLHLPLNEIVENAAKEKEVVDISAGKLNAKVYGPTVVAEPRFGNCLNFNGNNDYAIINPMPNFPSEAMTVLCWVRSNNQSKEGTALSYAKSSTQSYNEFQIYNIKNITPTVNNKWYSTGVAVNDGEWHCVAITWQSSDGQFKVYKDGKEVHSKVISQGNPIATGGALVLGQEQDKLGGGFAANQAFQGQMAHLRMYNRVLSEEDINECMKVDGTPPPMDINRGLQLHLPLNEIVENAAKEKEVVDVSPAKLKGKVNGEPKVVADSKLGNCLNFDGVDDYIQMPEMNIDYSQGLTVGAWVQYNSFKSWSRIIDFGNGQGNDNILFTNEGTTKNLLLDVYKGATQNRIKADGKLELNQWVYVTVTVDGSGSSKVYKNGEEVQSGLVHLPNNLNRTKNYIGKSNWSADAYFHGQMSNLRLYNRALSPEEINECMKVDQTPPPMDINRGLQLHLPLNEIVENAAKEKEVVDISAAKLNGKVYGTPTVEVDNRFRKCINFNGPDDYIELPVATIPETGDITISFWANGRHSGRGNSIILAVDTKNNRVVSIVLPWTDNQVYFDFGGANGYDRIGKLADAVDFQDQWNYWTFTKSMATGEMKIYVNSSIWESGIDKEKPMSAVTQVRFGSGYDFYDGKVAHLRIYDRVLSPEEINECMKVDETPPPMDINRGLQLHLPLNEIVENAAKEKEVVDVSAGKLNGKVNGATVVADSNFGNCLSFDGVDDYIQMPEMNIDYSQGLTFEAWVYSSKFNSWSRFIDFANGPSNENIIFGNPTKTKDLLLVVFVGSTRKAINLNEILEESQWLHLAATIDESGNAKVYKNGQEVGGGLVSIPNSVNRTKNYIGTTNRPDWSKNAHYFQGKMSNLRLYNRALSPEEINECMKVDEAPPPMDINRGLQLHLPLNEIVENAAKEKEVVDVSAGKLNGKVNGATVVADDRFGNCLNFDGVDDYIELPTATIPETGEITISFWANGGKSLPNRNSIILAQDKSNHRVVNIHLPWSDSKIYFDCGNTTTTDDSFDRIEKLSQATDFKAQWTSWVFTKNVATGEMKIYLNGVLWQSGVGKENPLSSITQVKFGCGYGFYNGKVAHLRIYDRVLSPEEINECMKVDGTPPPMDINRGLQLHLPLNEIVENAESEKEVVDVSAGKLNGKVNGATVVADDRFGKCINFDGVDDYIELPTATIPETGEITISFWANGGKSLPNRNSIILAQDKSNHRVVNIHLPWSDSKIYFDCGNTTTTDDSFDRIEKLSQATDFKAQWTSWVFTKNVATGEMKIYLNGVLWQSGVGKENPLSSITQVKFGCGYGFYNGKVAHLRIYDRVLSPEEINELMTFDEADETTTSTTDGTDTTGGTESTSTTDGTDTTGEAESTSTADGTDTTGETDSTSTADGTDATGETDSTSTTDGTDTTGETDSTSTTDETDATGGTDSTSTTDGTDATGGTDSTSTTDGTDTTGETDSTSTTDGTDTTGETDSTSTTDETSQPIDIDSGLHLNLPLNEIVENSAKEKEVVDASGGKLNGKVYGAKVIDDPNFGNCISFDGVDDYIELPPTAIPETNEITISFWANGGESLPKQSSILLAQDKTNHRVVNIHLPWSDSTVYFDCGNKTSSFDRIEQLAQVSDFKGQWNHWAFTKNVATGEMKIYLNGSLWQTVTDKDQELSQITQIKLGCGYGFYEGKVADLRIYDRVLSQEEINELMKVNQPATTSTTGETETTPTTDETDTTQKPMEYRIYQVKGNPTIKTGYSASEWTAVIAGFNSGAKQKNKASALTIMPLVEDEEWKIKCDIKDADDRYWDVAVLFIRNNMVNRVNNFYR